MKAIKQLTNLSSKTKEQYIYYLTRINDGKLPTSASIYFDVEKLKDKIKNFNDPSKMLIVNAIMTLLSKYKSIKYVNTYKTYKKYRDELIERKKSPNITESDKLVDRKMNFSTNNFHILPDDINQKQSEPDEKPLLENIRNPLNRFIYALYTLQVPRRSQDYYAMEIIKTQNDVPEMPILNYLCEDDKCFVFAKYKTSAIYKVQVIPISDELWTEYQRYKPSRSEKNNRLLQKENGDPVDNNQFLSYRLNTILGKGKSVNYLRHKYVRDKLSNEHKNIEEVATKMGHSFGVNNYYYNSV